MPPTYNLGRRAPIDWFVFLWIAALSCSAASIALYAIFGYTWWVPLVDHDLLRVIALIVVHLAPWIALFFRN